MCGIAGLLDLEAATPEGVLQRQAAVMASALAHRGPDDHGTWADARAGIAFGHQRLAVIDPSPDGDQPMVSVDGRYVLSYNGEIYGFRALRGQLERLGHRFRGRSDTEVLLAVITEWGMPGALARLDGMFAFVVWDRHERRLHLARDRIGEKPLYYGWFGKTLLFGSELRALRAHPAFTGSVDRDAVARLLQLKYIPSPRSIYREVRKLPPATVLTITADGARAAAQVPSPYWSAVDVARRGLANPLDASFPEAVDELDRLARDAVRLRMVADVPLGAFLSGGIDSSAVVALMQAQSDRPVRTFTIGVEDPRYNEADDAKAVAAHLGTDHTELYVTPEEIRAVIPELPGIYDEPFADSSQLPTILVSRLARRDVTVALSGDGGDEVFGGYNRHIFAPLVWRRTRRVPHPLRRVAAKLLRVPAPRTWDALFDPGRSGLPRLLRHRLPGNKVAKLATALDAESPEGLYWSLMSHWRQPSDLLPGLGAFTEAAILLEDPPRGAGVTETAMLLDLVGYLPDDILVKVDRATMAASLEARVPFLDHRLVEFAWRLPTDFKVSGSQGKRILRALVDRYVPRRLVDRPKTGFGVPLGEWLRGPLRDWAAELLDPVRLEADGILDPGPITSAWRSHLSRRQDLGHQLWDVLVLQSWLDAAQEGPRDVALR